MHNLFCYVKNIHIFLDFIHSWNSRPQLALIDIQFDHRKRKEFLRDRDRAESGGISSIMTKVEMAKDIHLQMGTFFDVWSGNFFCHCTWIGQVQSKLFYRLVAYELTGPYVIGPYPVFHIKCLKEFTFANEYILPFWILS